MDNRIEQIWNNIEAASVLCDKNVLNNKNAAELIRDTLNKTFKILKLKFVSKVVSWNNRVTVYSKDLADIALLEFVVTDKSLRFARRAFEYQEKEKLTSHHYLSSTDNHIVWHSKTFLELIDKLIDFLTIVKNKIEKRSIQYKEVIDLLQEHIDTSKIKKGKYAIRYKNVDENGTLIGVQLEIRPSLIDLRPFWQPINANRRNKKFVWPTSSFYGDTLSSQQIANLFLQELNKVKISAIKTYQKSLPRKTVHSE